MSDSKTKIHYDKQPVGLIVHQVLWWKWGTYVSRKLKSLFLSSSITEDS